MHGEQCIPLLQRAIDVAESIPEDAANRDNRVRMAREGITRMQRQIDDCKSGQEQARRDHY